MVNIVLLNIFLKFSNKKLRGDYILPQYLLLFLLILCSYRVIASKPHTKHPQEIWHIQCQLGIITDVDCPIDGGWSSWSPWSPCRGHCDSLGFQIRTRQCDNPPPSKDGLPCIGDDEETTSCHLTNCTVEDYRHLASGSWPRMGAMYQLEVVPILMETCLKGDCFFEAIEAALEKKNTWKLHPESIWNALHCVKNNMGCRVIGEWGPWGEWLACSAQCGQGLRCRLRRCDSPPPSDEELKCVGSPLEAQKCEGSQCAIEEQVNYNSGGAWASWQPWSPCSEKCGPGVRRRHRICEETAKVLTAGTWGTHCQGHHDELQVCENPKCQLDGGWTGWGVWGPCSRTCGAGKRIRHRTCTRPVPAGGGANCLGPKSDVESCHHNPCVVHSHIVAVLNGDSFLNFNFKKKRSTFFHLFIRFMPLSPYGTLVRRGDKQDPIVRISLQKWRVCVDARGLSNVCGLPRLCSATVIEPAIWHNALVTITNQAATLRLNDAHLSSRSTFPCNPELPDDNMNIFIGEKFHGEIQEVILNFIPLNLMRAERPRRSEFSPVSVFNVAFEEGNIEEGFLNIDGEHYFRLPCFDSVEWRLELTVKPKRVSGTLVFLRDEKHNSWFHLSLHNMRIKLQVGSDDFVTESSGSTDYLPNEWLDIVMLKQRYSPSIETSVNSGERIFAVLEKELNMSPVKLKKCKLKDFFEKVSRTLVKVNSSYVVNTNISTRSEAVELPICDDEFFIANIPPEYNRLVEDSISFSGVIGMISINGVMQDIHKLSIERVKRDGMQLSSRTASVSGSYHEAAWGFSNHLNLTCLHARVNCSPAYAHWLFLDTVINNIISPNTARSVDNGRVLRLVAEPQKYQRLLRGFYTCRSHSKGVTRNLVTYAVLGQIPEKLTSPDTLTAFALLTTLILITSTLFWIIVEAFRDIRDGYGFFRDRQLTPQEEAEAVCAYIDMHVDLIGSQSAANLAKARARRKGRLLASKMSVAIQEPQGMMEELAVYSSTNIENSSNSHKGTLPAIESCEEPADLYTAEPCYFSSPRHGSNITPRPMLTSSSTESLGPRVLCSRLLVSRGLRARQRKKRVLNPEQMNSNLLTIKSSTFVNRSLAHRILERFKQLRSDDS